MESIKSKAEKLREELEYRGKYYFKGFGALLQALLSDLDVYIAADATTERAASITNSLDTMVRLYDSIPFSQITNHPDYSLLLEIKGEIKKLAAEVSTVLNGKKDVKNAQEMMNKILDKGDLYRNNLVHIFNQLRLQPGHEKDGFELTDIFGNVFKYPF